MPRAYRLLLISPNKPSSPDKIIRSTQMIGWGLWDALSRLPHITLHYQDADKPIDPIKQTDFTLIHCCTGESLSSKCAYAKKITSKKVINIMEAVRPKSMVDYNFSFLPCPNWEKRGFAPVEVVFAPYISSLILKSAQPKVRGSILVDHPYPGIKPELMWCNRIFEWLEPLKDSVPVGQLVWGRANLPMPPSWVTRIPEMSYKNYLGRTAMYENFIMTHPESYGHSVTDMIVRGTRVLVPVQNGRTFANRHIVEILKLATFGSKEHLLHALSSPIEDNWRIDACTDMGKIVHRVDEYCQEELTK